jgi:DNA-binding NtrC family response regulator
MRGLALVLDDDAAARTILREVLTQNGWRVRSPRRAEFGLELAEQQRPALVLLDVAPPSYAPEAIASTLRLRFGPRLPIAAIGTVSQPDLVERIGAFAFLGKPFDVQQLELLLAQAGRLIEYNQSLRIRSSEASRRLDQARSRRDA